MRSEVQNRTTLRALCSEDARGSGEVVGYGYVCPGGCVEEWLDGGEAVVAQFEDEEAAGFEMRGGLGDELSVEFVAFFAAVEGDFRFVVADFAHERFRFPPPDIRRVAGDEIEKKRFATRDW